MFHDVDLLPEDDRNLYTCGAQPRHLSASVDKFHYRLPYKGYIATNIFKLSKIFFAMFAEIFGGVSALSPAHLQQLNGFSNQYWGWGGEDDDMSKRIKASNLTITRYKMDIAR